MERRHLQDFVTLSRNTNLFNKVLTFEYSFQGITFAARWYNFEKFSRKHIVQSVQKMVCLKAECIMRDLRMIAYH